MSEKNNSVKRTNEEQEEYIRQLEEKLKGRQNREYKSRLFSFIFGREEIRQNIIHRNAENNKVADNAELTSEVERIFQEASPDIEVKVRMININYGHNRKILAVCRPLEEYAWFVEQVRKNHATREKESIAIGQAIDKAIDEMPEDFEIKKFILSNRAEVKDMCLTEYNETETMEMLRQEGRLEGRQEGRLEGRQEGLQKATLLNIRNLMDSTGWPADRIMELLKIPKNQRAALYANLSKNV